MSVDFAEIAPPIPGATAASQRLNQVVITTLVHSSSLWRNMS
jgi:hypothetical protein